MRLTEKLTNVANKIREKLGITSLMTIDEMVTNIDLMDVPTGEISITENGTYNVSAYASAAVTTPVPTGTKSITTNGTHDVAYYENAEVNVPGITPTGTKSITANGTYDVTEYASAEVNTPTPAGTKQITTNGTHEVAYYANAEVNVPGIVPTGTTNITSNGTYDVTSYASAEVAVPPSGWNVLTSNATGMRIYSSSSTINLTGFNSSNLTTMESMFSQQSSLENLDLSNFDFSNITRLTSTFSSCENLKSINFGGNCNTSSNLINIQYTFNNCTNLGYSNQILDLGFNFDTSAVSNTSGFFSGATAARGNQYIKAIKAKFDLRSASTISSMFAYANALEHVCITKVKSNATAGGMFNGCTSLQAVLWAIEDDSVIALGSTFTSNFPSGATLYVPDNLVASYKAHASYSAIASQIDSINNCPQAILDFYEITLS